MCEVVPRGLGVRVRLAQHPHAISDDQAAEGDGLLETVA
jgi:hypothetical protein